MSVLRRSLNDRDSTDVEGAAMLGRHDDLTVQERPSAADLAADRHDIDRDREIACIVAQRRGSQRVPFDVSDDEQLADYFMDSAHPGWRGEARRAA